MAGRPRRRAQRARRAQENPPRTLVYRKHEGWPDPDFEWHRRFCVDDVGNMREEYICRVADGCLQLFPCQSLEEYGTRRNWWRKLMWCADLVPHEYCDRFLRGDFSRYGPCTPDVYVGPTVFEAPGYTEYALERGGEPSYDGGIGFSDVVTAMRVAEDWYMTEGNPVIGTYIDEKGTIEWEHEWGVDVAPPASFMWIGEKD
jgi:hypothetical protein